MEALKNRKLNLIEIFLILSPIIDLLTAVTARNFEVSLSIGIVIRAVLMLYLVGFTFFKSTYKNKKLSIAFMLIILLYSVIYAINIYLNKGMSNVFFEIKNLIKTFYFPICLIGILNYMETKEFHFSPKLMIVIALEYITLLFIPVFFNIGYESYAEDKIGTIGWFFSSNEISAIYAILFVFIIFSYDHIKNKLLYFALVIYCLNTVIQIGTKIPAIAVIFAILCFVLVKFIRYFVYKAKFNKLFALDSIILIISSVFIIAISPVVTNYDIYKNYLINTRESIEVSSESTGKDTIDAEKNKELLPDTKDENKSNVENLMVHNNKELTQDEMATIIHSGRMETKNKIEEKFKGAPPLNKLFGIGKLDLNDGTQNLCEIDYYDILFTFGIIGFILFFMPIAVLVLLILKSLNLDKIKNIINNNTILCFGIAFVIGVFLCAIAGHTFTSPDVSIFIAIALLEIYLAVARK